MQSGQKEVHQIGMSFKMQREGYYDYMLRRSKEEDEKMKEPVFETEEHFFEPVFEKGYPSFEAVNSKTITETQLFEDQIRELNSSYYSCINRIKELVEENQQLKNEIEELKNNANV